MLVLSFPFPPSLRPTLAPLPLSLVIVYTRRMSCQGRQLGRQTFGDRRELVGTDGDLVVHLNNVFAGDLLEVLLAWRRTDAP